MFFMFFKIVINNSLENRRPKSNFVIFYCMHCKKNENFYNTYNLKLFLIKSGTCIKLKTLDGASCVIFKRHCMYQIMHIPKHLNILKHFIQIFIYKNNMYQCVPQDDAFIFLLGRRLK